MKKPYQRRTLTTLELHRRWLQLIPSRRREVISSLKRETISPNRRSFPSSFPSNCRMVVPSIFSWS